jgi:TRAP-type uncharacterized transport system fused permease subunit
MSISQIIVLAAIVGAFVLFAVVLAWVDYRASAMALNKGDKNAAVMSGTAKARWPQPSEHLGADARAVSATIPGA